MEKFSLIFCLLLCLLTCCPKANSQDRICDLVYCGQGNCSSTSTIPFFECNCFPGWKQVQIGPLTFGSCLLPNCTTDLQCGNAPAPLPRHPPAALPPPPPPQNFTDTCNFVWCGEGSCVPNGTGHICECHEGANNLINKTDLPCLKPCSLGADCSNLGLLPPPSATPPSPNSGSNGSPPPSSPNSGGNGWKTMNSSKNVGILIFISLTFIWTC